MRACLIRRQHLLDLCVKFKPDPTFLLPHTLYNASLLSELEGWYLCKRSGPAPYALQMRYRIKWVGREGEKKKTSVIKWASARGSTLYLQDRFYTDCWLVVIFIIFQFCELCLLWKFVEVTKRKVAGPRKWAPLYRRSRSVRRKSMSLKQVNLTGMFSGVWPAKTFPHNFTETLTHK